MTDKSDFFSRKTWAEIAAARAGVAQPHAGVADLTFLVGPPAAGKTTYARERMTRGDVLVDLDALFVALTGLPLYDRPDAVMPIACEARDAVLYRLCRPSAVRHAYVISSAPTLRERQRLQAIAPHARLVVLDVDAETCIGRLRADDRRRGHLPYWVDAVRGWWSQAEHG
jgi:hypothetical protein